MTAIAISQPGPTLALSARMPRLLLAIVMLVGACYHPGAGYRTSSVAEAVCTAAQVAAVHPSMLVPRSDNEQRKREEDADAAAGKQVVPEGLLGPDMFLSRHHD